MIAATSSPGPSGPRTIARNLKNGVPTAPGPCLCRPCGQPLRLERHWSSRPGSASGRGARYRVWRPPSGDPKGGGLKGHCGVEDDLGPDIAFVRLTQDKATSIERHSVFLNLEKNEQQANDGAPENSISVDVVVGGVEELGQKINMQGDRKLIVQNSLLHVGHAGSIEDGRDGFDRLLFTPMPGPEFVPPSSYGGMSGGGCFRVYFPADRGYDADPLAFHLLGVAFWETKVDGKADKIICHGRVSMREKLLPAVRANWPSEV